MPLQVTYFLYRRHHDKVKFSNEDCTKIRQSKIKILYNFLGGHNAPSQTHAHVGRDTPPHLTPFGASILAFSMLGPRAKWCPLHSLPLPWQQPCIDRL